MIAPMITLLVEDDEQLARLTIGYLTMHGVTVVHAPDGERALDEAVRRRFDVVVLDLILPGRDGLDVCQTLRGQSDVPIVIVSARSEEADRVVGLELGADDYMAKPCSPRELLARMRAVVRRDRGEVGPRWEEIRVGELVVHAGRRHATFAGRDLRLTTYEFDLLLVLARRPGRPLSRETLLDLLRGPAAVDSFDRSIDAHVSRLRAKLGDAGGALIRTVHRVGYLLSEEDPSWRGTGATMRPGRAAAAPQQTETTRTRNRNSRS